MIQIQNQPVSILLSQPITCISPSPNLTDIPTLLSALAVFISFGALMFTAFIYYQESKAKFRETYLDLVMQSSKSYFKLLDLFIKVENIFRHPTFIPSWNEKNAVLNEHLSKTLHLVNESALSNFPTDKLMAEIITFMFERIKVVCYEPDIKAMKEVGIELGPMSGDLSAVFYVYIEFMSIEQNHDALNMLLEGNKKGFEESIETKPRRKKEFLEKYKEVFDDVRSFTELYDSDNAVIRKNLNKSYIRLADDSKTKFGIHQG